MRIISGLVSKMGFDLTGGSVRWEGSWLATST